MTSYILQLLWLFLLAGLGGRSGKSEAEKNTVVAAFMLFSFSYNVSRTELFRLHTMLILSHQMGSASIPYLLGGEIPNASVREKTQSLGASWNVIWAFVTNYIIPYLIRDLHFGVGWVFGTVSGVAFLFTFFLLPETKVI